MMNRTTRILEHVNQIDTYSVNYPKSEKLKVLAAFYNRLDFTKNLEHLTKIFSKKQIEVIRDLTPILESYYPGKYQFAIGTDTVNANLTRENVITKRDNILFLIVHYQEIHININ